MNALKISAQFAAYTWYSKNRPDNAETRETASEFARNNWISFLPLAHEGLGRLLMRIAKPTKRRLSHSAAKRLMAAPV
ncbi:MAG: hypothetical protein K2R98_25080 [Gemmataceae bacterium]|nr:hypothetical protein [Gemmataceae bacterium]